MLTMSLNMASIDNANEGEWQFLHAAAPRLAFVAKHYPEAAVLKKVADFLSQRGFLG
jgi:hypothetical protein